MFSRIGRVLRGTASAFATAAFSVAQLNERLANFRAAFNEARLRPTFKAGYRATKAGPGRVHWYGRIRKPRAAPTAEELEAQTAHRFAAGYMNRGEAIRYIAAATTAVERARRWAMRYGEVHQTPSEQIRNIYAAGHTDPHKAFAAELYQVPLTQVTPAMRAAAKLRAYATLYSVENPHGA